MKFRSFFVYALVAGVSMALVSCEDNEPGKGEGGSDESYTWGTDGGIRSCDHLLFNEDGSENPEGTVIGNGDAEFVFTGKQTLAKGTYVLKGWVYVADGAELTIEPGTVIKGDKTTMASLIVERGGKIFAEGNANEPIVFTSNSPKGQRKPGDWGGLILCGKAPNNQQNNMQIEGGPRSQHGGTDANDNSGVLSYVRIEFAGYPFQTDQEINGLTLGSIGSKTQIDHIQVSYSNDDSYEWFGGDVDCKYLIAYKGWDDDFDTDNGFSGKVQYCLSVRDPRLADTSRSNGFESDNCSDGAQTEPYTTCVFSNVTFVGPRGRDNFENTVDYINGGDYNPGNGSSLGLFQSAMQVRRSSRLNCFNSVAIGFPIGIIIDGQRGNSVDMAKNGTLKINNVWFADMGILGSDFNGIYEDVLYDAVNDAVIDANQVSYSHTYFLSQPGNQVVEKSSLMLGNAEGVGADIMPQAGSPLLTAAAFEDSALDGMDKVSYIGAFSANDNWMEGWTNFDPNNADY